MYQQLIKCTNWSKGSGGPPVGEIVYQQLIKCTNWSNMCRRAKPMTNKKTIMY